MRRAAGWLIVGLVLTGATPGAGGWVVTTLHEVPTHLAVGRPTVLRFTLRQHGQELLGGRDASLIVRREGARWFSRGRRIAAVDQGRGVYQATITPSDTGLFEIRIDPDYSRWESRLLPIRVVAAGVVPPVPSEEERGRALFIGKGCVTCHFKADDPALAGQEVVRVGPDLGGRAFPPEWLATKLADPAAVRTPGDRGRAFLMPDLELDAQEIAALVSYINRTQAQARRM